MLDATLPFGWMFGTLVTTIFIYIFLCGLFYWLWNSTLPELFSFPRVNFWQAIKVILLATLLFGGVGSLYSQERWASNSVSSDTSSESHSVTHTFSLP